MSINGSVGTSKNILGDINLANSAEAVKNILGNVNFYNTIVINAYDIAVKYGFNGTEREWLASLKAVLTPEDKQQIAEMIMSQTQARIGNVTILADKWVGEASPYSQVVEVEGVTENSQVDLTPSVEQLAIFHQKDLAFVTENEGGVVTVYAIGDKPTADYVIQATITEVVV